MSDDTEIAYVFSKELIDLLRSESEVASEPDFYFPLDQLNVKEVSDALHLVRGGYVKPNVFNTVGWLEEISERYNDIRGTPTIMSHLLREAENSGYSPKPIDSVLDSHTSAAYATGQEIAELEKIWNGMWPDEEKATGVREYLNSLPNSKHLTPLDAFVDSVFGGYYPTPETILAVAKAVKLYLLASGDLTLEEVFFGPPVKRAGSRARQSRKYQRFLVFHDILTRAQVDNPLVNVSELAKDFLHSEHESANINPGKHYSVKSFVKAYERWKEKYFPDK